MIITVNNDGSITINNTGGVYSGSGKLSSDVAIDLDGHSFHIATADQLTGIGIDSENSIITIATTANLLINGAIELADIIAKDFPDNDAAAAAGVKENQIYNTDGVLKIRKPIFL